MKFLTDRQEIARHMNFNKYPVLYIDMDNRRYKDDPTCDYTVGCQVRVAWDDPDPRYKDMYCTGDLYYYEGKFKISNHATCLHADFGRHDVLEMCKNANTPMIHKGDTVVIVQDYSARGTCLVRLMKMPNRMDKFCQVVATLEDIEEGE